ncbi:MAG: TIGR01906 family membrane protein [Clostridiales bacterium]|jgi:integral membrane protein (TIGR01906 family)|nr:TIGR01906 family membrane protein [Clostridiales bacterium]
MNAKSNALAFVVSTTAIFLLFIISLLTAIELVAFDLRFYQREYGKLDRPAAIGISEEELMTVTRELLAYVKGKRPDLNIQATIKGQERAVFNQREIDHMKDVKVLFERAMLVRKLLAIVLFCGLLVLYFLAGKNIFSYLFKSFVFSFVFLFILFGILYILINTDFTLYWDYFHYIFFDNDLWQLDPRTDVLIQMVPEQFFYDLVVRIILYFIGGMVILGLLFGFVHVWLSRGQKRRRG